MSTYRRVTYEDRCQISALIQVGFDQSAIAIKLNFHKSTISRELSRNGNDPKEADDKYLSRFSRCRRKKRIGGETRDRIEKLLKQRWSPLLIAGRLRLENLTTVSHDTIYNFIAENRQELGPYLRRFGRRGGGRFVQRKSQQARILPISTRPEVVSQRVRLGDWERDGMRIASKDQLLIITDRKSRYTMIANMGPGKIKDVTRITAELLNSLPIKSFTVTNDNGLEFRDSHNQGWPVYHCDPGKPQQRGTVEHAIGLLRQYIPRKTSIETLGDRVLKRIEEELNSRPRRCLDYRTPYEVMFGVKVALAS